MQELLTDHDSRNLSLDMIVRISFHKVSHGFSKDIWGKNWLVLTEIRDRTPSGVVLGSFIGTLFHFLMFIESRLFCWC